MIINILICHEKIRTACSGSCTHSHVQRLSMMPVGGGYGSGMGQVLVFLSSYFQLVQVLIDVDHFIAAPEKYSRKIEI